MTDGKVPFLVSSLELSEVDGFLPLNKSEMGKLLYLAGERQGYRNTNKNASPAFQGRVFSANTLHMTPINEYSCAAGT